MVGGEREAGEPPPPVFTRGLGAVYCLLARQRLTAELSAGLGG